MGLDLAHSPLYLEVAGYIPTKTMVWRQQGHPVNNTLNAPVMPLFAEGTVRAYKWKKELLI